MSKTIRYEIEGDQLWRIYTNRQGLETRMRAIETPCLICGAPTRTSHKRYQPAVRCHSCRGRHASITRTLPVGSRRRNSQGYVEIKLAPNDPLFDECNLTRARRSEWVLEHRLVMRRAIRRPFLDGETVHHINGDVGDNRLENLQLMRGSHGSGSALRCADCGSNHIISVGLHGGGLV